jgi:signal transduction histidine kinase
MGILNSIQARYFCGRPPPQSKPLVAIVLASTVTVLMVGTGFVLRGGRFDPLDDGFLLTANLLVFVLAGSLSVTFFKFVDARAESAAAKQALELNKAQQRVIVQNLPVGIATIRLDGGIILDANSEFRRIADGNAKSLVESFFSSIREPASPDATPSCGADPTRQSANSQNAAPPKRNVIDRVVSFLPNSEHPKWLLLSLIQLQNNSQGTPEAVIVANDITSLKNLEIELQSLLKRFVHAQEEERLRISRELHDVMGQELTAMALQIKNQEEDIVDPVDRSMLFSIRKSVERLSLQTHDIAAQLRPMSLNEFGLAKAVEDLLDGFQERTGIGMDRSLRGLETVEDPEVALTIYRVIQEALTNITRHSAALTASVTVQRSGGSLRIAIEDAGKGFDMEKTSGLPHTALGLTGMRERLFMYGGSLTIESKKGHGTAVFASLPLANLTLWR